MTSGFNWFVAEAIFQATVQTGTVDLKPVREKLLFLVYAHDQTSAEERAREVAKSKEHSYKNEKGQQVTWTFDHLVEVTEMIDAQFEEGTELRSTMIPVESDRE